MRKKYSGTHRCCCFEQTGCTKKRPTYIWGRALQRFKPAEAVLGNRFQFPRITGWLTVLLFGNKMREKIILIHFVVVLFWTCDYFSNFSWNSSSKRRPWISRCQIIAHKKLFTHMRLFNISLPEITVRWTRNRESRRQYKQHKSLLSDDQVQYLRTTWPVDFFLVIYFLQSLVTERLT